MNARIHYPDQSTQLWGSIHHNKDHDTSIAVRVYTPTDQLLNSVDELRLVHQALQAATADVLDQMADLASQHLASQHAFPLPPAKVQAYADTNGVPPKATGISTREGV